MSDLDARRPPMLSALALALALVLSSCSGSGTAPQTGGPSSTPTDPVPWEAGSSRSTSTGATATKGESSPSPSGTPSSRTFPSPTDTGEPFDREEFVGGLRQAVRDAATAEITVVVDGATDARATGVQDLDADALDMEVVLGGHTLTYRYVDGRYYLAQPPKWVEVDEDDDNPVVRATIEQVEVLSMRRQLTAFTAGVTSVGDRGSEEIGGTTTTHYTAQVDTARALRAIDVTPQPGTPKTVIYDVWLDDDGLIRKMVFTQAGVRATLRADHWGEPVDIPTPRASEIVQQ